MIITNTLITKFNRRRYGNQTYTWIYFQDENGNIFTPRLDPYPAVIPAHDYIEQGKQLVLDGIYFEKESK